MSYFAGNGLPRILLAVNRRGWAFHRIALQLASRLGGEFDMAIVPSEEAVACEVDLVVALWWLDVPLLRDMLKPPRILACVYDAYAWKRGDGPKRMGWTLDRATALAVANEQIGAELAPRHNLPTHLVEDGVDCSVFRPSRLPWRFTAGWCGQSGRIFRGDPEAEDLKGVRNILAATHMTGARMDLLDASVSPGLPFARMPRWHAGLSVYVCASIAEGTPNPLLEAMASGRPVITTPVGLAPKLVKPGINGWIVDHSADGLARALGEARGMRRRDLAVMGMEARRAVEPFDWTFKIKPWRAALKAALA